MLLLGKRQLSYYSSGIGPEFYYWSVSTIVCVEQSEIFYPCKNGFLACHIHRTGALFPSNTRVRTSMSCMNEDVSFYLRYLYLSLISTIPRHLKLECRPRFFIQNLFYYCFLLVDKAVTLYLHPAHRVEHLSHGSSCWASPYTSHLPCWWGPAKHTTLMERVLPSGLFFERTISRCSGDKSAEMQSLYNTSGNFVQANT